MNDLIAGHLCNSPGRILIVQLGLGLALETGIGMLDADHGGHSVPDIGAGKILVLFL